MMIQIENLESRRLLASTAPIFGTYRGTETYTLDGQQQTLKATITISPIVSKHTSATTQATDTTQAIVDIRRQLLPFVVESQGIIEFFELNNLSGESIQSRTSGNATALATTDYVAVVNTTSESGTFQVKNGGTDLEISDTLTTGIFQPSTILFSGTKVSTTTTTAAASSSGDTSPATTLAVRKSLAVNPVLGTFLGHMTRASDGAEFKTKATVTNNKKGHPALHMQLVEPGIGTTLIDSVIHPTHTGSFVLDLGGLPTDGIIHGHITHTGRLVLSLVVPGVSNLVGSQKRH
jgi:hypothetical protein